LENLFCSLSVWNLFRLTPWVFLSEFFTRRSSLCLLRFHPQIRPTRLAINSLFITARAERKVRLCVKLFDFFVGEYSSVGPEIWLFCPKFSGDSYVEFQEKTISGEFFRNFVQTKDILYLNLWNFALLSEILFCVRIAPKKFTQVPSYVVCTQVRRHVLKQITERRYGVEKPRRFVFGKPVLFTLDLGFTTPYSWNILVWNFYQTFVTVSTEFCLRFEPQVRPTRFAINSLFITARAESKVLLGVKLFHFFRGWILIRLTWNL